MYIVKKKELYQQIDKWRKRRRKNKDQERDHIFYLFIIVSGYL
jgi:hypothetical protein